MNRENAGEKEKDSVRREKLLVEFLEKRCRVCSFSIIRKLLARK